MKIGSNKIKIIAVSLLRFIVVALFQFGSYVSSIDNPNINYGAVIVMNTLALAFVVSPLRHLNEVLEFYPDKIVMKKRELSFSTIEEIEWMYEKGVDSQERYKVLEILKKVIPVEEKYVPVYAYWDQSGRWIKSGKYYALGITDDRLYIVPLYIAGEEIGYKESFVITRESLGKIDSGKPGGGMRFVHLYDKNRKEIFKFTVDIKNTKLDKEYPVNITQKEEFHAFFAKLEEWEK